MRIYVLAAVIALAGIGMLAGAALIAHNDQSAPAAGESSGRGGDVWGENYFPNVTLTTHEGEKVRFFDDLIEGKVFAINFMYTYCPDTCPVQTSRLLKVAELLGDRLGEDVFFYSISIDPEYDTQEVLAEFADSWNIPEGWTFLTGEEEDITRIRDKLGMRLDDVRSGDLADHTVNFVLGNQETGRWMKRNPFENPYFLAEQLGNWLHGWKAPREARNNASEAPKMRQISDGEYVFRNLCSSCHTIGEGDVRDLEGERIGPDLLNVTRKRDREWLERWLKEPDKMLEEGDPLATKLYEEWRQVPMPNLRLTQKDVDSLLGYMARESRRIRDVRAGRLADHSGHAEHGGEHGEHEGHDEHEDQHSGHAEHEHGVQGGET